MLAQAFEPRQWLIAAQTGPFFYQAIGWKNPEELFGTLGEHVVMIVDVDHNDSDDRLAIETSKMDEFWRTLPSQLLWLKQPSALKVLLQRPTWLRA